MIIQYDTRPDATVDEKLRSLINSIQLAFGEVDISVKSAGSSADISSLLSQIQQIRSSMAALAASVTASINSLSGRVTALEESQILPDVPTTDGAYKLTVTVTDGEPVYTWELA